MTLIPTRLDDEPSLSAVFARFRRTVAILDGQNPEDDLANFGEFLILRDTLFSQLAIPVTGHNSLRLYDAAVDADTVDDFLLDADHFFPAAIRRDEALFLSAMATYFGWRDVRDLDARIYDIEGFLDVPHHRHNTSTIGAWLAGRLSHVAMLAMVSEDEGWLAHAVC